MVILLALFTSSPVFDALPKIICHCLASHSHHNVDYTMHIQWAVRLSLASDFSLSPITNSILIALKYHIKIIAHKSSFHPQFLLLQAKLKLKHITNSVHIDFFPFVTSMLIN